MEAVGETRRGVWFPRCYRCYSVLHVAPTMFCSTQRGLHMARTPEQQREYMKAYRDRKRAEQGAQGADPAIPAAQVVSKGDTRSPLGKGATRAPLTDRERGLPRSNYFSDPAAPGGWGEVIASMNNRTAQMILDRIATPRRTPK